MRGPLPPVAWQRVPGLPAANPGPLCYRHGCQVPSSPPGVPLLSQTLEQGLFQGAGEQALLPPLLHQAIRLMTLEDCVSFVYAAKMHMSMTQMYTTF